MKNEALESIQFFLKVLFILKKLIKVWSVYTVYTLYTMCKNYQDQGIFENVELIETKQVKL